MLTGLCITSSEGVLACTAADTVACSQLACNCCRCGSRWWASQLHCWWRCWRCVHWERRTSTPSQASASCHRYPAHPCYAVSMQHSIVGHNTCPHEKAGQSQTATMHVVSAQAIFAVLAPGKIVPNLVAGAIAEAGAQQAGDMMQDFKCVLASLMPRLCLETLHHAAAVLHVVRKTTLVDCDAGAPTCLGCARGSSLRPC